MDVNRDTELAREVFDRHEEVYRRGHENWMRHVRRMEDYYLAGGRQWLDEDRATQEEKGVPCFEVDVVKPAVNAAIGYQIANRVDISYVPRGGEADEKSAKLMSKVVRQVLDNANWRFSETDIALDGFIQQRGYLDLTMNYDDNDLGEPTLRVIDPMDAMPDPDGKTYDPDGWSDFQESRWLTEAQIEYNYGRAAATAVVRKAGEYTADDENFGNEHGIDREGFGERQPGFYSYNRAWYGREGALRRYRVIHRQVNQYENVLVARWPTGDIRIVEGREREYIGWLIDQGIPVFKRRMRMVDTQIAAPDVMLHSGRSPYKHITAIPFFPYFRRGRTVGMIDNLASVQDMLNKFISQFAHVVNSSANGGWQGEANALENMTDDEFQEKGAETGLMLLRKQGAAPFEKIPPSQIPTGLDKMIDFAYRNAQTVSGFDDSMNALAKDMSGVAIQSLQYAAQQKLAIALDNLSRTRRMVASRTVELVQEFMGAERVLRIAEEDPYGTTRHVPTVLNQRLPDGSILNDMTIGTYDLVLNEQPAQVTFDNSQFEQIKDMKKEMGIPISDARIVRASNVMDKSEIAEELEQAAGRTDPVAEAEAELKKAQARKADAEAVNKSIEAQFSAVKTAREIVMTPQAAALADALLLSGGFKDQNAAPIIPEAPAGMAMEQVPEPENSHPLLPTNPDVGLDTGLTSTS